MKLNKKNQKRQDHKTAKPVASVWLPFYIHHENQITLGASWARTSLLKPPSVVCGLGNDTTQAVSYASPSYVSPNLWAKSGSI